MIVCDEWQLKDVVVVICVIDLSLVLFGFVGGVVFDVVEKVGFVVVVEVFVDCVYQFDGQLVFCIEDGVVLYDLFEVVECMVCFVFDGVICVIDGIDVWVVVQFICVYGDSFGLVEMVVEIKCLLQVEGIMIVFFVQV